MKGLASDVSRIFEDISQLECIKPFVLVGGTALSLQLGTRLSEDLDFMRWKTGPDDRLEIGWNKIKRELESKWSIENMDVLGFDQALFQVEGVKLSFYAAPRYKLPIMKDINFHNNVKVADPLSIGAMKMEVLSRRSRLRDYYDIYSILKAGYSFHDMVKAAIEHSDHVLKEKNLLAILSNGERFYQDKDFKNLSPVYDVSAEDIQQYIMGVIVEQKELNQKIRNIASSATITSGGDSGYKVRVVVKEESFMASLSSAEVKKVKSGKLQISDLAFDKLYHSIERALDQERGIGRKM